MAALGPNTKQDCGVFGVGLDFRVQQDYKSERRGDLMFGNRGEYRRSHKMPQSERLLPQ